VPPGSVDERAKLRYEVELRLGVGGVVDARAVDLVSEK
jgi:hypothetical protein